MDESSCTKDLWVHLKNREDEDKEGEGSGILPPPFWFFSGALSCFQSPV
jgi:hypothetical protein